jgi:hypothetical protein
MALGRIVALLAGKGLGYSWTRAMILLSLGHLSSEGFVMQSLNAALLSIILLSTVAVAAPPKPEPLCPVSGHACDPEATAAFEGGKVCFCCEKCVKAFEADSAKFAAKARQQLVVTGQFNQTACPLSGGKVKAGTDLDVGGVKVGFCCNNCKGKVAKGFTLVQ